jgi:hypothetical protein
MPAATTRATPERPRNRRTYSCTHCQRRKTKCNRLFPCSPCTVRDLADQCYFDKRRSKNQNHDQERCREAGEQSQSSSPVLHRTEIIFDGTNSMTDSGSSSGSATTAEDMTRPSTISNLSSISNITSPNVHFSWNNWNSMPGQANLTPCSLPCNTDTSFGTSSLPQQDFGVFSNDEQQVASVLPALLVPSE